MNTFTEEQVIFLVRKTLEICVSQMLEFIKNETIICEVGKDEELKEVEITLKPNAKRLTSYIYPELSKHGITFTEKTL